MKVPTIEKLSVPERLALLESICESLADEDVPLSPKQRDVVAERLAKYRRNPVRGMPIDEAIAEIRARHK
jgi:putative addiction module component (TIGR02574 family)